jgi:hypothetical protein
MEEKKHTPPLNLNLPEELHEWIEKGVSKRGGTKTDFVRNKLWEAKEREEKEK